MPVWKCGRSCCCCGSMASDPAACTMLLGCCLYMLFGLVCDVPSSWFATSVMAFSWRLSYVSGMLLRSLYRCMVLFFNQGYLFAVSVPCLITSTTPLSTL